MKFVNRYKIWKRLLFVFAIIIGLYTSSLLFNMHSINTQSADVSNIYNVNLVSIDYLIEADRDAYQASVAISQTLSSTGQLEAKRLADNIKAIRENTEQVKERYDKFSEIFNPHAQAGYLAIDSTFHRSYDGLLQVTDSIVQYIEKKDFDHAEALYFTSYMTYFEPMRDAMDQFTGIHLQDSERAYNSSQMLSVQIKTYSLIIFFVILLIIIISAYVITQSIKQPLQLAVQVSDSIAEGDLTQQPTITGRDETTQVLESLSNMAQKLRNMVGDIKTSASNVLVSSTEITAAAQQLSQAASEQAASTEQITSSIEQMVASINQNSDNAEQTEKLSILAAENIKVANLSVEKTVEAMKMITQKISVINALSEKTDLLAVNAAIEAARAGEKGRGFAIVAGEVRELAIQSQQAAAMINELSSRSVQTAIESGTLLARAIPDIQNTANLVQEIAAASREQNAGATQINIAVQQLAGITQQNSAASEEFASNAEELSGQSKQLSQVIAFFKTTHEELDASSDKELEYEIARMNTILEERKQKRNRETRLPGSDKKSTKQPEKNQKTAPVTRPNGLTINMNTTKDDEYESYK